jgi:hypothetical protein
VRAAWVDPLVLWKRVYRVRQYRDKAAELQARLFIEQKMRQHNKVTNFFCFADAKTTLYVVVNNQFLLMLQMLLLINNDCVRVADSWT